MTDEQFKILEWHLVEIKNRLTEIAYEIAFLIGAVIVSAVYIVAKL